jgi:hypothetical protein
MKWLTVPLVMAAVLAGCGSAARTTVTVTKPARLSRAITPASTMSTTTATTTASCPSSERLGTDGNCYGPCPASEGIQAVNDPSSCCPNAGMTVENGHCYGPTQSATATQTQTQTQTANCTTPPGTYVVTVNADGTNGNQISNGQPIPCATVDGGPSCGPQIDNPGPRPNEETYICPKPEQTTTQPTPASSTTAGCAALNGVTISIQDGYSCFSQAKP